MRISDWSSDVCSSDLLVVADALGAIPNPLVNEAITVTVLAGITGSASDGMSIALAAMSETFIANAAAAGIPLEVFHRVAAMASGRSEEHTSELQSLMRISYAVFCLKKNTPYNHN